MKQTRHHKIFKTIFALTISIAIVGCGGSKYHAPANQDAPGPVAATGEDPEAFAGLQRVGVKSAQQIYATMQELTGIQIDDSRRGEYYTNRDQNGSEAGIRNTFTANRALLGTSNSAGAFNGSQALAIFKLSFSFCNTLSRQTIEDASNGRINEPLRFFGAGSPYLTLSAPATEFPNEATRKAYLDLLLARFWTNYTDYPGDRTEYVNSLDAQFSALLLVAATSANTQNAMIAMCSIVLADASAYFF